MPRPSKNRPIAVTRSTTRSARDHAWRLVRASRGSPGLDGISFDSIENAMGVEMLLRELARDLHYGLYKVSGVAGWRSAHALSRRTSESRVRENRMQGLMKEGKREPALCSTLFVPHRGAFPTRPALEPVL